MDKRKCAWTNRWSSDTIRIAMSKSFGRNQKLQHMEFNVLPEHESDLRTYINNVFKFGPRITIGILIGTLCLPLFRLVGWRQWDGFVFVAVGLMLLLWPYTTTLVSVQTFGGRNMVRVSRIAGLIAVAFGVYRLWSLA